ncbi:MAG TPA: hypothetical protein VEA61_06350 [Allosphingosinicella sp.]|nr:hypothetical protein [Allosphingosinicella sp.]
MITSVLVIALLAGAGGTAADKPRKPAYDPNRMICKRSDEPGSRIQRRQVCATAAEWAERKRIEMQHLLEKQRNGAQ